jgi:hypothetical protein
MTSRQPSNPQGGLHRTRTTKGTVGQKGDTLVIDTVGFKIGPFSAIDQYGTPFTQALHVVERYRLIDNQAARAAWERGGRENSRNGQGIGAGWAPDPADKG